MKKFVVIVGVIVLMVAAYMLLGGSSDCPGCNGRGKISCGSCSGDGLTEEVVNIPNYSYNPDSNQMRTITMRCFSCNGAGELTCFYCNGTGKDK